MSELPRFLELRADNGEDFILSTSSIYKIRRTTGSADRCIVHYYDGERKRWSEVETSFESMRQLLAAEKPPTRQAPVERSFAAA